MSDVKQDWIDLARGMAERAFDDAKWNLTDGSQVTSEELRRLDPRGCRVGHEFFVTGYVAGFLAAKKRDVVTVDPYKVPGEGR